jgi:hypothetical protein
MEVSLFPGTQKSLKCLRIEIPLFIETHQQGFRFPGNAPEAPGPNSCDDLRGNDTIDIWLVSAAI